MEQRHDISSMNDIHLLVNGFYSSVREHPLLAPIFERIIQDRWSQHLEKMYRFWQTVLLGDHTYFGSPFPPHAKMPLDETHFEAWLKLWHAVIDQHFIGDKADEAKWRGDKMAVMFLSKINYYRENASIPLV